jgi:copper chaperone CopZ
MSSQNLAPVRLQLKIGGMSCSFCSMTIERVLTRMDGVAAVHVSLAHEEVLIEYNPALLSPLLMFTKVG